MEQKITENRQKLLSFSGRAEHDRHVSEHDSSLTASLTAQGTSMTAAFVKKRLKNLLFFKKRACHARSLSCQASCQATVMLPDMPVMLGPARKT